jgi:hypothetical protein
MSEEGGFGVNILEKLFGFILLVVGIIATYYTIVSSDVLDGFTGFFGFLTVLLMVLGFILMIAKTEE